jgi:polyhydroxybutyrate depolymerase
MFGQTRVFPVVHLTRPRQERAGHAPHVNGLAASAAPHARRVASAARAAIATLAVALAFGCGSGLPDAAPAEGPPPSDAELVASRPYRPVVPTSYAKGTPMPLVLLLHGYGSDGKTIDAYYGFSEYAERAGFLGVAPNGSVDAAGNRGWHVSPVHSAPYDVEYLRGVITDMASRYTVDPARIYVIGLSEGAHMAHRLGCELSAKVAAFVSQAGQVKTQPQYCAPTDPVSALEVHGDDDSVIGYDGDVQNDPPDPSIPSAHETIGVWARNEHCTGPLAVVGRADLVTDVDGEETRLEAYQGCPAGIDVELWTMEGVGHHPTLQSSALDRLYGFLSAHPKGPR